MRKRFLVLARSYKAGGNCIAGRELIDDGPRIRTGPWFRPIDERGDQGALAYDQTER